VIPNWTTITLDSEVAAFDMLLDLGGKQWLSRGQSEPYGVLIPSIDRGKLASLTRREKLAQERSSIESLSHNSAAFRGCRRTKCPY
jgi:hypothetical protein